jgi:hypothetical protein
MSGRLLDLPYSLLCRIFPWRRIDDAIQGWKRISGAQIPTEDGGIRSSYVASNKQ